MGGALGDGDGAVEGGDDLGEGYLAGGFGELVAAFDSAVGAEEAAFGEYLEYFADGGEREVGFFGQVRDVVNPAFRVAGDVGHEDDSVVGQFVEADHFS